jgi:hypothetical protein
MSTYYNTEATAQVRMETPVSMIKESLNGREWGEQYGNSTVMPPFPKIEGSIFRDPSPTCYQTSA